MYRKILSGLDYIYRVLKIIYDYLNSDNILLRRDVLVKIGEKY